MKIAIPAEEKSMESNVCQSFGRAPYFVIYDTESKHRTILDNDAANSQGGAGIKAAQLIVDQKVSALLTPRCGENAAGVLEAAHIDLYKTKSGTIRENVDAFASGELSKLENIHPGFHGNVR